MQAMAECSGPPQSTRKDVLGTFYPSPELVDSSTPNSAPLSRCTLLRHSSFVRAVCVDALVRICAGGDQRWSSLPRQWSAGGIGWEPRLRLRNKSSTSITTEIANSEWESAEIMEKEEGLVAAACNHPNCLVLPFRLELI